MRVLPRRRLGLAGLVVAGALIAGALAAVATAGTQGGNWIGLAGGGASYNGAKTTIWRNSMTAASSGASALQLRYQECETCDGGLYGMMQLFYARQASNTTTDCGTGDPSSTGSPMVAEEWVLRNSNSFHCLWGDLASASPPEDRFAIINVSGTTTWQAYLNGILINNPVDASGSSGDFHAWNEVFNNCSDHADGTFGPTGYTAWQVSTNHGNSYTVVGQSSDWHQSVPSGWSIGVVPSPFRQQTC